MTKKIIATLGSLLISFLLIRELLRFLSSDFAASILPGWNSQISSIEWELSIGAAILLILAATSMGLLKLTTKFVERIFSIKK